MDPVTTLRKLGKLKYAVARLPLSLLDASVVRHWDEDAAARVGFERYLGTLDLLAGRLLADDAIRQRGSLLWHSAGSDVWAQATADQAVASEPAAGAPASGPVAEAPASGWVAEAPEGGRVAEAPASGRVAEAPEGGRVAEAPEGGRVAEAPEGGRVAEAPEGGGVAEAPASGRVAEAPEGGRVAEAPATGLAAGVPGPAAGVPATGLAAEAPASGPAAEAPADGPAAAASASDPAAGPAAGAPAGPAADVPAGPAALSPVVVIFTLSAAVQAESVALCGDFNDWSADATPLELGSDGYWRVAVALQPGRSYRYRYLINGERWENARDADAYVPNPYGGTDSVVVVE